MACQYCRIVARARGKVQQVSIVSDTELGVSGLFVHPIGMAIEKDALREGHPMHHLMKLANPVCKCNKVLVYAAN